MDVIYGLIPSMIIIGLVLVIVLFWAIKSGQFDDLEGDAHRILMDEDLTPDNSGTKDSQTKKTDIKGKNLAENADKIPDNG